MPRLCEFYPGICLKTEEKAWRNLSSRRVLVYVLHITKVFILPNTHTLKNLHSLSLTHTHTHTHTHTPMHAHPHITKPTHTHTHTYTHPHISLSVLLQPVSLTFLYPLLAVLLSTSQ